LSLSHLLLLLQYFIIKVFILIKKCFVNLMFKLIIHWLHFNLFHRNRFFANTFLPSLWLFLLRSNNLISRFLIYVYSFQSHWYKFKDIFTVIFIYFLIVYWFYKLRYFFFNPSLILAKVYSFLYFLYVLNSFSTVT
jgi:hypothetical protein